MENEVAPRGLHVLYISSGNHTHALKHLIRGDERLLAQAAGVVVLLIHLLLLLFMDLQSVRKTLNKHKHIEPLQLAWRPTAIRSCSSLKEQHP